MAPVTVLQTKMAEKINDPVSIWDPEGHIYHSEGSVFPTIIWRAFDYFQQVGATCVLDDLVD